MKNNRPITILLVLCLAIICVVSFRLNYSYYPIPQLLKLAYSSIKDTSQQIDAHFKINEKGYVAECKLKDTRNVPHIITASFVGSELNGITSIPSSFRYTGKLRIQVSRNNRVVYEKITDVRKTYNIDYGAKINIGGIFVAELPFPLADGPYDNITIRVSVEDIDKFLSTHLKDVELSITPKGLDM